MKKAGKSQRFVRPLFVVLRLLGSRHGFHAVLGEYSWYIIFFEDGY